MPRKPNPKRSASAAKAATRSPAASGAEQKPIVPRQHDRYDYSAIVDRPPLRWPNGARVAVWVIPNIEHFLFDRPSTSITHATRGLVPDVLNYSWRDYGVRVGIWRMMEVMDKYKVRGSISLSVGLIEHHPEIIKECVDRNWEFFSHGIYNTRYAYGMTPDEERAIIRDSAQTIAKWTGQRMDGWLAPALSSTGPSQEST